MLHPSSALQSVRIAGLSVLLHIQAWASALPSYHSKAMREASTSRMAKIQIPTLFVYSLESWEVYRACLTLKFMSQGLKYNVDIVMCIDCTGSMGSLLETVKENALKFYPDLISMCEAKDKDISELRIRVIGFRDFGFDNDKAIIDSGFLSIPEQEGKFKEIVNSFIPDGGGPEPESGLEALSMAINSDWTKGGDRRRHVIVVWSDASTHELGESGQDNSLYPTEVPANFDELTDWWEDEQAGKMNHTSKRLIIFAPDAKKWTEIGLNWNNTIHHPAKAGMGLCEVDYKTILSTIVNSI